MILALLGVIICQILLFVFALILIKWNISRLKTTLIEFFQPGPDQTPSQFAGTVDALSKILAGNIVASVKGYLMSLNSAEVRSAKAEQRRALQESAPPLVAALLGTFPGLGRAAMKNPELAQLVMAGFSNMGKKSEDGPGNNGASPLENPFKI